MSGLAEAHGHFGDADNDDFELRPQDKRIRELNREGKSAREISDVLRAEGMPLSKSCVHEHLKEMRLIFGDGIQANHRAHKNKEARKNGKWYKVIEWLVGATQKYTESKGFKPMIRTMFYDATDAKIVNEDEYRVFVQMATDARMGYVDQDGELLLPVLPPDCFEDDSRKTINNYDDSDPTEVQDPDDVEDSTEHIMDAIGDLMKAPLGYSGTGTEGEPGERGGYWYGQPEYVEVWEEKVGLMKGFKKILEDVYVTIRGIKGYSGFSYLYECVEELKKIIESKGLEPEDVTILYCGDWDPSGENIIYYIQKRLRQLGLAGVNVVPIAVTPEQIDKYHFPLLPVEKKPDKKAPNPNMREYVRRHGTKATHINAFFTDQYLPIFKEILVNAVNEHWNQSIYDEMVEEYEVNPPEPAELLDDELRKRRRNQYRIITKTFSDPNWFRGLPDAPDPGDLEEEEEDEDAVIWDDEDE